jgi:hypothetical protein
MKALFFRSLIAAILLGPAIGFVSQLVSFRGGIKYEPPVSEAERQQMGSLTLNEMEATLSKRRIKMTRWDWLRDSIPYSYYWKQVAFNAIVPSSGVFLGCMWVGWMEERHLRRLKLTT